MKKSGIKKPVMKRPAIRRPTNKPSRTKVVPAGVRIRAVGPSDRGTIEDLFGARGACAGCWCMYWRLPRGGRLWRDMQGEPNKRAIFKLLAAGRVRAVIAEVGGAPGGEPVGWCSFGPRADFPKLARSRVFHRAKTNPTAWCVICFFIKPGWRGKGLATALLQAATAEALRAGASEIEGFPAFHREGTNLAAAFAWTGVAEMFEAAGYCPTESTTGRRLYVKSRI
jgi:GNAT superfamily N-acetyltransferase